ncbi:hypothetical protein BDV33DRAFT_176518 [Aspergillus novoparasiticus]|uniref:Uncharacterized protein n=1 Tax=Aspergillus novoparasiticus TaxID=986946 RepID=A0A5N6EKV7_9EURO|nr:hypothetical protein BDV33DRAFT_176518 [Aspergillus novoparasiticus]
MTTTFVSGKIKKETNCYTSLGQIERQLSFFPSRAGLIAFTFSSLFFQLFMLSSVWSVNFYL